MGPDAQFVAGVMTPDVGSCRVKLEVWKCGKPAADRWRMGVESPRLKGEFRSLAVCGGTAGSTGLRLLFEHEPSDHGIVFVVIIGVLYKSAYNVSTMDFRAWIL